MMSSGDFVCPTVTSEIPGTPSPPKQARPMKPSNSATKKRECNPPLPPPPLPRMTASTMMMAMAMPSSALSPHLSFPLPRQPTHPSRRRCECRRLLSLPPPPPQIMLNINIATTQLIQQPLNPPLSYSKHFATHEPNSIWLPPLNLKLIIDALWPSEPTTNV